MGKIGKHIRISPELNELIEELSARTGKNHSLIIEEALRMYIENTEHTAKEIELLTKENEKMKIIINTLQIALSEKDAKYEDMKKNYEERIADLKSILEQRKDAKKWWQFWKQS